MLFCWCLHSKSLQVHNSSIFLNELQKMNIFWWSFDPSISDIYSLSIYKWTQEMLFGLKKCSHLQSASFFNKSLYLFMSLFRNVPKPTFCPFTATQTHEIISAVFTGQINHLQDLLDWMRSLEIKLKQAEKKKKTNIFESMLFFVCLKNFKISKY